MSTVVHFIRAGGFVMYPLLVLSLLAVCVIAERFIAFAQFGGLAPGLLAETLRRVRTNELAEAERSCASRPGPLAACLAVILRHRNSPMREVERLVEETGQSYFIRLERFLPILDTTTTISPLLGLLGTIVGMIGTFNAIAAQQTRGNSDAVLSGVGEALYATATGLIIAVICFIAYNYFSARLRTITAETEQASTKLINALAELHHEQHGAPAGNTHIAVEEIDRRGVQAPARA